MGWFDATHICRNCGVRNRPYSRSPGSASAEAILWLIGLALAIFASWIFLAIPFAYSGWRYLGVEGTECPKCCAADAMVPLDTPIGRKLASEIPEDRVTRY